MDRRRASLRALITQDHGMSLCVHGCLAPITQDKQRSIARRTNFVEETDCCVTAVGKCITF